MTGRQIPAALAAIVLATTFVPRAAVGAGDPIEIPVIVSQTGALAFVGTEEAQALHAMEPAINAAGGIAGRPLAFVIQDDQSSPQVAVQLANALLAKKARIILGTTSVGACTAIAPLIKQDAVLYGFTPAFHPAAGSYGFSAGVSTADAMTFIIGYLRKRGIQSIATISSNDANGQDAERTLRDALALPANAAIKLVADEYFNPADLTVAAQLEAIKRSNAQALVTFSSGAPFGTILRGVNDAGLSIPVLTSPASLNATVIRQFARYIPKELLIPAAPSDAPDVVQPGALKSQIVRYLAAMKTAGLVPDHTYASVWDPALIVVEALRKYGPEATAAQIHDYIASLRWIGANGEYDFPAVGQRGLNTRLSVMMRYDAAREVFVPASGLGGAQVKNAPRS
jgi:branched-chain amino acid transport system substrate-binding protein